jgi:hypothetical protein
MAKVTLRIVGLFFNEKFDMTLSANTTVKNVVDAYIKQSKLANGGVSKLTYLPQKNKTVRSFTYHFDGTYNFDGLGGPAGDTGRSLGDDILKAGIFKLAEMDYDVFKLAWQYYVVSPTGEVKSKTPSTRKFTKWGETPDYHIADGDEIIWRLVAIYKAEYESYS